MIGARVVAITGLLSGALFVFLDAYTLADIGRVYVFNVMQGMLMVFAAVTCFRD